MCTRTHHREPLVAFVRGDGEHEWRHRLVQDVLARLVKELRVGKDKKEERGEWRRRRGRLSSLSLSPLLPPLFSLSLLSVYS